MKNPTDQTKELFMRSRAVGEHFFWLSFAEPEPPKGRGFLGVVITRADNYEHAILRCTVNKLNPGGEVSVRVIPPEFHANVRGFEDKLFDEEYLRKSGLLSSKKAKSTGRAN